MDAPALSNKTEFAVVPQMLVGKDGERLVVLIKATFMHLVGSVGLELAPKAFKRGIRSADVPWGDPEKSSIKYPSDLAIAKPGTDVIVVASAHAPGGKPVTSFDAGLRVGRLEKMIRIFGLRVWEAHGAGPSAARPTTGIEIRYDYAWGGLDLTDLMHPVEEARNPVGMGIARDSSALTHKPAPFIEDPLNPIGSAKTRPPPAGLGVIGRHWEPRRKLLGTYDATWLEERAPLLPIDFDDRANLCASPGLTATPPLIGGEEVALLNLIPGGGAVSFKLPKIRVTTALKVKDKPSIVLTPYLDTVLIDTVGIAALQSKETVDVVIELVWRAAFPAPRRAKDAQIHVSEEDVA